MKHNLVIKLFLLAIVVLLTANLIRPLVSPSISHAAPSIQYKVVMLDYTLPIDQLGPVMESLLNEYGKKGWEMVTAPSMQFPYFIFKK